MRIIAGSLRGRQIAAPPGLRTRPMLDRVRQAVFNIVGAAYGDPGSIPPVSVLDVFAGSGALGIEALSRGAAFCCFVEEDRTAARTLQSNLKTLGLQGQTQVVQASALTLKAPRPPSGQADDGTPANSAGVAPEEEALADKLPVAPGGHAGSSPTGSGGAAGIYSIIFLDPPYPLSRDNGLASPIGQLLTRLPQQADLDPAATIVLRHEVEVGYDERTYGRLKAFDVRRYGGMAVTFMELARDDG